MSQTHRKGTPEIPSQYLDMLEVRITETIPGYVFCAFCCRITHVSYSKKCNMRVKGDCLGKWYHNDCLSRHKARNHRPAIS